MSEQKGLGIEGLQEAMKKNQQDIAALKPRPGFAEATRQAMIQLHRHAVAITHVWVEKGGGLRASHRMELVDGGLTGIISIDPSAVNPRGQRPSVYGVYEHARGGAHAFYDRAIEEAGDSVANRAIAMVESRMSK
jgi:hypothetical protein